jgi:hypothetical protein
VLTLGVIWWGVATALTALLPTGIAHAVLLLIAISSSRVGCRLKSEALSMD